MTYTIEHTAIGRFPFWYHLDTAPNLEAAARRARNYVLDHGGYVCVRDDTRAVVFGTDPTHLERAISNGTNQDFPRETARRAGYCA